MRRYEQIYILRPSLGEDEITTVIENANQIILDEEGAIITLNRWGMRKLAYPIKKELQGYYVLCDFAATPNAVTEIERKFRIDDAVLKYLTVKLSDAISAEEISAAQAEFASQAAEADSNEEEAKTDQSPAADVAPAKPVVEKKQTKAVEAPVADDDAAADVAPAKPVVEKKQTKTVEAPVADDDAAADVATAKPVVEKKQTKTVEAPVADDDAATPAVEEPKEA